MEAMMENADYFSILRVDRNSNLNDIKKSYLKLCLEYHPDKNLQKVPNSASCLPSCEKSHHEFLKIQKAWKILQDPILSQEYRKTYENKANPKTSPSDGKIHRDSLQYNAEEDFYFHPCRCGGAFEVCVFDFDTATNVFCTQCSLTIDIEA
eukprot:Sdes_comp9163_c0_seq1m633